MKNIVLISLYNIAKNHTNNIPDFSLLNNLLYFKIKNSKLNEFSIINICKSQTIIKLSLKNTINEIYNFKNMISILNLQKNNFTEIEEKLFLQSNIKIKI